MGLQNFSLLEAVAAAIGMEEEGIRFYSLAEQRTGDPAVKKVFAFLRDKEFQHVETFRKLHGEIAALEGDPDADLWLLDPQVATYFRAAVESTVFPAAGAAEQALAGLESVVDVLRFALRLEKETIYFYQELLAHSPWPQARELVGEVIAEERRHVVFIHEKLRSLGA
jgi:rubrerythrin